MEVSRLQLHVDFVALATTSPTPMEIRHAGCRVLDIGGATPTPPHRDVTSPATAAARPYRRFDVTSDAPGYHGANLAIAKCAM